MSNLIYCIEDDEDIRELIIYAVKSSGFEVYGFENAAAFYDELEKKIPDLILMDVMLPDKNGIKVLKDIRECRETEDVPVIMLTAKSSESDKVKGFDAGADDYITKPFGVLELISRIKAVLKRSGKNSKSIMEHKGIRLDVDSRSVKIDNNEIILTYKEYELLYILIKNKGTAVTRESLLKYVWGYNFEGESRTLDVHIGSLRHKLGDRGTCIETIRNVGYRLS